MVAGLNIYGSISNQPVFPMFDDTDGILRIPHGTQITVVLKREKALAVIVTYRVEGHSEQVKLLNKGDELALTLRSRDFLHFSVIEGLRNKSLGSGILEIKGEYREERSPISTMPTKRKKITIGTRYHGVDQDKVRW